MTLRTMQELLVSSVRLFLLRDLIKFMTENNDSRAYVDENIESNAVAKFFLMEWHTKPLIVRFCISLWYSFL